MKHMKAEDVKTFGRYMKELGKNMQDNPDRYVDLLMEVSPPVDPIYDFMGVLVGYKERGWEEIIITIKRNT